MASLNNPEEITLGGSGSAAAVPRTDSPGARLAAARQGAGLSVGDIAAKMRMGVQQIDAIERGDYGRLPTGTFLRGFVRSYAKLVGLDPEAMLSLLEETHADSRRSSIVVPTHNIKMAAPGERYSSLKARALLATALLVAIAGGTAYWWLEVRPQVGGRVDHGPLKATVAAPAPAPATAAVPVPAAPPAADELVPPTQTVPAAPAAPGADASTKAMPPVSAMPMMPVTPALPESPVVTMPQPAPLIQTNAPLAPAPGSGNKADKPIVPKGSGSLHFAFAGESWIEVVDGSGRTVISRRFQGAQSETVVGKLPLSVVIGNATVTRLQYNDLDFDLRPHTRVSVARFTLK